MQYPTSNGLIISPYELEMRPSRLNPEKTANWNNHHGWYERTRYVGSFIYRTLRNLDAYQYPMLIDQHCALHEEYDEPPLPRLLVVMNRLEQAYETCEPLKHGSMYSPKYEAITVGLWAKIIDEYCTLAT